MEFLRGICEKFSLDLDNINQEELLISITHKQILSENKNRHLFEKTDYFYEIGRRIYSLLLKSYIYRNIGKNNEILTKLCNSSYGLFLEEFCDKYDLKDFLLYKEEVINDKVLKRLLLQFIGYLYLESSVENLEKIFSKVFAKEKFDLIGDYYGFLQAFLKNGQNIRCIQLSEVGESHNKTFTYQLQYENITVVADGPSKKRAAANCAKKFVHTYIDREDILKYLFKYEVSNNKKKKTYKFMKSKYDMYTEAALNLKIPINEFIKCLTHKSLSNEYILKNNSNLRTFGAELEEIYLLIWIYNDERFKSYINKVLAYVLSKNDLYEKILTYLKLENLVLAVDEFKSNLDVKNKAYEDAYKALLYTDFYKNNDNNIFEKVRPIYNEIFNEINVNFLDPSGSILDFIQTLKIESKEEFIEINLAHYECHMVLSFGDFSLEHRSTGNSVVSSRLNISRELLIWIHNNLNKLFLGEDLILSNTSDVEKILQYLLKYRKEELLLYFKKNNYFLLSYALNSSEVFLDRLKKFTKFCFDNFNLDVQENIFELIKTVSNNKPFEFFNKNILYEAIFNDIYSIGKNKPLDISKYSIDKRSEILIAKTEGILGEKLEENALFIKGIADPSEELQLIAIKNNLNSIYYLSKPTKKVIEYVLNCENEKIHSFLNKKLSNDEEFYQLKSKKFYNEILVEDNDLTTNILPNDIPFDIHLQTIFKEFKVKNICIATGYMYKSGLDLINNEILDVLRQKDKCRLLIGSLQKYFQDDFMPDMDRKTAEHLNSLLTDGCLLKTFENSFYHGKLYVLECEHVCIVIIGSTNVSKSAFRSNKELSSIFFYKSGYENEYTKWFEELWNESTQIESLDLSKFENNLVKNSEENQLNSISRENLYSQISLVKDIQLKERLLLWLKYSPNKFYENVVISKQNYIAFEYLEKNMVVLDSLYHGNSFFVFYDTRFSLLNNQIKDKTKREVFELSKMEKRGYHIRNQLTLELNIKSYFL